MAQHGINVSFGLTIKAREVKRKPMTSLAYGPWPITIRMPWKNGMGSVLTLQVSVKKKRGQMRWWKQMAINSATLNAINNRAVGKRRIFPHQFSGVNLLKNQNEGNWFTQPLTFWLAAKMSHCIAWQGIWHKICCLIAHTLSFLSVERDKSSNEVWWWGKTVLDFP